MSEVLPPGSKKQLQRIEDSAQLLEDLDLVNDAEFFANPKNRLDFLASLDFYDFAEIIQHVNARVRGFEPRDKVNRSDKGSSLPMLPTPDSDEKPIALEAGFHTIKQYLQDSDDTIEQKIRGAGMAVEALIIWVHPFNDGNGRTSRFMGKFIEDGTVDTDKLVAETASNNSRQRLYDERERVDQGNMIKGQDLILTDEEVAEYRKTEVPFADGISLSLMQLLSDKSVQDRVESRAQK